MIGFMQSIGRACNPEYFPRDEIAFGSPRVIDQLGPPAAQIGCLALLRHGAGRLQLGARFAWSCSAMRGDPAPSLPCARLGNLRYFCLRSLQQDKARTGAFLNQGR